MDTHLEVIEGEVNIYESFVEWSHRQKDRDCEVYKNNKCWVKNGLHVGAFVYCLYSVAEQAVPAKCGEGLVVNL